MLHGMRKNGALWSIGIMNIPSYDSSFSIFDNTSCSSCLHFLHAATCDRVDKENISVVTNLGVSRGEGSKERSWNSNRELVVYKRRGKVMRKKGVSGGGW